MNILFICDQNVNRSKTAEFIYSGKLDLNVRSAGIYESALHTVNTDDIKWAHTIVVFEQRQMNLLKRSFSDLLKSKEIINLEIEDLYFYMDEELIYLIKKKMIENGLNY